MPRKFTGYISENQCIGDSLGSDSPIPGSINGNFYSLDTGLSSVSASVIQLNTKDTLFTAQFNTLIQTLTGFANTSTTYNNLSTSFRALSSLILT
jgi:hypothetical protein